MGFYGFLIFAVCFGFYTLLSNAKEKKKKISYTSLVIRNIVCAYHVSKKEEQFFWEAYSACPKENVSDLIRSFETKWKEEYRREQSARRNSK